MNLRKDHYRVSRRLCRVAPRTNTRITCTDIDRSGPKGPTPIVAGASLSNAIAGRPTRLKVSRGTCPDRLSHFDRGERRTVTRRRCLLRLRERSSVRRRFKEPRWRRRRRRRRVVAPCTVLSHHILTTVVITLAKTKVDARTICDRQTRYNSKRWITRLVCR